MMTSTYEMACILRREMGLRAGRDYALRVSERDGPLDAEYRAAADLLWDWLVIHEESIAEQTAPMRKNWVLLGLGE